MSEPKEKPGGSLADSHRELINAAPTLPDSTPPSRQSSEKVKSLRTIKGTPFCWQHKPALDRIREAFDGRRDGHTALAAYLALTEIASDKQSERFNAEQSYIAHKAGMSVRTFGALLPELEGAGVLRTHKTALKAPLIYELVATVSDAQSLPNDAQRLRSDAQSLPNVQQVAFSPYLPTNKENKEELNEENKEHSAVRNFIESIYDAYPKKVAKPKALKAIAKAIDACNAATLLARTQAYAAAVKGDDMAFIPHPSTWFNEARYNDDPATWTKKKAAQVIDYSKGF